MGIIVAEVSDMNGAVFDRNKSTYGGNKGREGKAMTCRQYSLCKRSFKTSHALLYALSSILDVFLAEPGSSLSEFAFYAYYANIYFVIVPFT